MSLKANCVLSPSSPSIGIYTGRGASHSWLWFAEILDRIGSYHVRFVDESDILSDGLDSLNVLLMSGGDTFTIAEGLGAEGSNQLRSFIERGGLYIGSCAGAYLPLRSSMDFLNRFNFIDVKISNISRRLPAAERSSFERYACSSYGCDFVFHVVREDVVLKMVNGYQAEGQREMIAPLYGGPSMLSSEDIEPIAIYKGFTKKTKFLVEKELAERTLIGNIAVAKKSMGKGHLYVFGPHFEHPHYPTCNLFLLEIIHGGQNAKLRPVEKDFDGNPLTGEVWRNFLRDLRREVSNSRIATSGMNDYTIGWLIGNKYYEPEKIQVFLEVLWKCSTHLESGGGVALDHQDPDGMISRMKGITDILREMKKGIDRGEAMNGLAEGLFPNLRKVTSDLLAIYFRRKRIESIESQR